MVGLAAPLSLFPAFGIQFQATSPQEEKEEGFPFSTNDVTFYSSPPLTSADISVDLTKILEQAAFDAGFCTQGELAWEWYLNNYEFYPGVTTVLENNGFINPLLDPEGKIKAWAQEVTQKATSAEEKMRLLAEASFRKVYLMEIEIRKTEYQPPFTASQVHDLEVADCNEFFYLFLAAGRSVGLEVKAQITLKIPQPSHMNPVVKIGGAFYQINFPEKTIAAVSASEINLATAEAFFTSYHLERAAYFQKNHLPAEATRELNLIASIDPKGEYTNLALGLFNLSLLDNHIQAKDYFLKVIQVNPKNTIALVGMGLIHAHFKEVEKAKEYFDQAIDSNPQYALPYYLLYDLSLKTNDQEQAQKCLRALVAINPLDILAISLVAGDYLQNKSYQELQSFLDDAELGFDFNHFLIDYYRGIAYFETQQPQKAKQSLEISFQETSGMVFETSLLLGQIARQRNDLSQAAYHFNLVSAVKPDFCPAYLELAQIYKNQGEQSKAREMEKQAELCGKQ